MSVRTFKKLSKKLIHNTKPFIFLCIFAYVIVQPHRFVVDTEQENSEIVRAEYEELLNQASEPTDASIQFETLIVGENWEATINYLVAAWDSLWSIAKSFWTTSKAIIDANNIEDANKLNPWQKLIIAYNDGVFVNVKRNMTIKEFANFYELDKSELLSLNYFENEELMLEEGWQVAVPLNQVEAEEKGLVEKEAFVKLDLPPEEELIEQPTAVEQLLAVADAKNEETPTPVEEKIEQAQEEAEQQYEQIVISAEETEAHLENLKKQEEDARLAAEAAEKAAEEARIAAEEARVKAEQEKTAAAQRRAEEAKRAAEAAKIKAAQETKRAQEQEAARKAAQEQAPVVCWANQCTHKNKCWNRPNNWYCAETDPNNAWLCNSWYVEYAWKCVEKWSIPAATPRVPTWTTAQWYFNPHKVDSNVYWRWPWHCTAMAAYMWSQNFGIRIRDYWTWNAKDWLRWAKNAWFVVNMTPAVWALMVTWNWYGRRWSYGHVMYVESVDRANWVVTVVDMNYKGTYIATRRTQAIRDARWFIHPSRN